MELDEKKNLYRRFLNKELNATELNAFFGLVESGAFDEDFLEAMPAFQEQQPLVLKPRARVQKLFVKLAVAASTLLVLGTSYIVYQNILKEKQLKQQATFSTITVPTGKMKIITLADHSVVTLISGAVFKYPAAFASNSRKVFLVQGKAFFEIAKDKSRPFTVYSNKLSTTALGTSFTVENYGGYHMERVKLFTGKVQIGSNDKDFSPLKLTPGQQYSREGSKGVKNTFDTGKVEAYREDGTLKFEDTSLKDALIRVAVYYNVFIDFEQLKMSNYAINGQFKNEPVEDVLHTILFIHHLKFRKTHEGYTIMK